MPSSDSKLKIDFEHSVLLLVDIQPDFMPGGALPVTGGDEIVAPIRDLMLHGPYTLRAATQDWHPHGHASFASSYEDAAPFDTREMYGHVHTLWPDHCLQGSPGAQLHPDLPWEQVDVIIRKGSDPDVDSYSAFRENWNSDGKRSATGLAGYLHERGIQQVFCCGLARDVCVKWTAEDAADAGFDTFFLWNLTRAVDPESDAAVRQSLTAKNVRIIESASL